MPFSLDEIRRRVALAVDDAIREAFEEIRKDSPPANESPDPSQSEPVDIGDAEKLINRTSL